MERKILKAFLAQAKKARSKQYTYYDYVKLSANCIQFASNYLNVKMQTGLHLDTECYVAVEQLAKAVGVSKAKTVNISVSKDAVTVDGISLSAYNPDNEFLVAWMLRPMTDTLTLELGSSFLAALAKCIPFTTNEHTRYELDNVLIDFAKSVAVATDGRTLAVVPFVGGKMERQIVLPVKSASLLVELLDSSKPVILQLEKNGQLARWEQGDYQITVRLSESKFPPYEKVVPDLERYEHKFGISKKELEKVTNFLKVFEVKKGNENEVAESTTTSIDCKEPNKITFCLVAKNQQITVDSVGTAISIKVNQRFLSRLLSVCDNGLVVYTRANDKPLVATEGGNVFVVLPIFAREAE